MGSGRSSSKRKSSSSLSKKRSRKRSQVRKKRNGSRSRKYKSKELRDHYQLSSYSDDESDSSSSESSSSYSSEDDYRRRRRFPSRKGGKGSKKRNRRRSSYRSESSQESPVVKRKKGSIRDGDMDRRKKARKSKRKRRRDASVSSGSSGSWNCSTCQSGSNGSERSQYEKSRSREIRNDLEEDRNKKKKTADRSKSCSCTSNSKGTGYECEDRSVGGSSYQSRKRPVESDQRSTVEVCSRRLKSVITVAKEPEAIREGETPRGNDDYPSCKSAFNEEDNKSVSAHCSHFTSEEKEPLTRISEVSVGGKQTPHSESKREISNAILSSDSDHLESILRQRALENLKKFKGGLHTKIKAPVEKGEMSNCNVKQLPTTKAELPQMYSSNSCTKDYFKAASVFGALGSAQINSNNENAFKVRTGETTAHSLEEIGHALDGKYVKSESKPAKVFINPPNRLAAPCDSPRKGCISASAAINKPKPTALVWRREASGDSCSVLKQGQGSTSNTSSEEMMTAIKCGAGEMAADIAQTECDNGNNKNQVNFTPSSSSSISAMPAEQSSHKQQGEAKEGSQFEQKTMSVMKGGEMVQVSYKVYIPKKAPSLARRQLQR